MADQTSSIVLRHRLARLVNEGQIYCKGGKTNEVGGCSVASGSTEISVGVILSAEILGVGWAEKEKRKMRKSLGVEVWRCGGVYALLRAVCGWASAQTTIVWLDDSSTVHQGDSAAG